MRLNSTQELEQVLQSHVVQVRRPDRYSVEKVFDKLLPNEQGQTVLFVSMRDGELVDAYSMSARQAAFRRAYGREPFDNVELLQATPIMILPPIVQA